MVGRLGFWFGVSLVVLGSVMSFVPGAECQWYVAAGLFVALGGIVPKWQYRISAVILCSLCFYFAYAGYWRGIDYQDKLRKSDSRAFIETRFGERANG